MLTKKTQSLLGLCAAILAGAAGSAYGEGVTGYASFHVERMSVNQFPGAENCLTEDNGAVVNNCTQFPSVNLVFNLPSNGGVHTVTIQDYWNAWSNDNAPYDCVLYAYNGQGPSGTQYAETTFTQPLQIQTVSLADLTHDSLQLICWNVPVGAAIANINWY